MALRGPFSKGSEVFRNWGAPLNFGKPCHWRLMDKKQSISSSATASISNELHHLVSQIWGAFPRIEGRHWSLRVREAELKPKSAFFWKISNFFGIFFFCHAQPCVKEYHWQKKSKKVHRQNSGELVQPWGVSPPSRCHLTIIKFSALWKAIKQI